MSAAIDRLGDYFEFARHTPGRQIARRVYLAAERRLAAIGGARGTPLWTGATPRRLLQAAPPSPGGEVGRTAEGWRATFLNRSVEFPAAIDWVYGAGDPRWQLWRMHLHYFAYLPQLTMADAEALITDWITRCRPRGAAAAEAAFTPYALSLRLSAWLAFWSSRGEKVDPAFEAPFVASLREQASRLAANLETDIRGNHLIKNIRALAEAAAAFDDTAAARWSRTAWRLLDQELDAQILPDGFHYELSPSYHAQVMGDLLALSPLAPPSLKPRLEAALDRMAQALADLTHPDGWAAQFGDAGRTMATAPSDCLRAWSAVRGLPPPAGRRVFALTASGYYGARLGGDYLVAKMGRLGPDALMAHAHGDWGSFEWSVGGARVVVDQGVFEYVAGDERARARSTASHNTVMAEGIEQARFFGAFRCGRRPAPQSAALEPWADGFVLSGDLSPAGRPSAVGVRRRVAFAPGSLRIEDTADRPDAELTSRLLLHPQVEVQRVGDKQLRLALAGRPSIQLSADAGHLLEVAPAEWWPDMGERAPTLRLTLTGSGATTMQATW